MPGHQGFFCVIQATLDSLFLRDDMYRQRQMYIFDFADNPIQLSMAR